MMTLVDEIIAAQVRPYNLLPFDIDSIYKDLSLNYYFSIMGVGNFYCGNKMLFIYTLEGNKLISNSVIFEEYANRFTFDNTIMVVKDVTELVHVSLLGL